jgi:chloramphenicol O-acetyltransferase type B
MSFIKGAHTYGEIQVVGKVGGVIAGKFCSIADGVKALMVGHNTNWISTYPFTYFYRVWKLKKAIKGHPVIYPTIVIENDVWIGSEAVLLGGVTIGNGAVVGANSFIKNDVPPYTIVSGNPAHIIKSRFKFNQIEALLKIKWWDWPDKKIEENIPLLCSSNIQEFIDKHAQSTG